MTIIFTLTFVPYEVSQEAISLSTRLAGTQESRNKVAFFSSIKILVLFKKAMIVENIYKLEI